MRIGFVTAAMVIGVTSACTRPDETRKAASGTTDRRGSNKHDWRTIAQLRKAGLVEIDAKMKAGGACIEAGGCYSVEKTVGLFYGPKHNPVIERDHQWYCPVPATANSGYSWSADEKATWSCEPLNG